MLAPSLEPDVVSWTYLLQFLVCVPLAVLALRSPGQSWHEAIDLKQVPAKQLMRWTGIWLLFWAFAVLFYRLLAAEADPFLQAINGTRHLGLTLASLLLAPVMEELVFRAGGFRLWRRSRLGLYGTLFLTSLLFMLIHIQQYSRLLLMLTFCFGILLGLAKERTGSLLTPLMLHGLNNLVAVVLIIWLGVLA